MGMKTQIGKSERFGRWLGRGWRGYARRERRVSAWLVARGAPAVAATALLWIIKLIVLGAMLYVAFWLALLFLFAVVAAWAARNMEPDHVQPEWRNGAFGFGLYHADGSRIDPHDPDEQE